MVSSGPKLLYITCDMTNSARLFALGGLGEIGMNCLAIEQDGQVMIVDCGITFDHRGLGIDVVHPELGALEAYRDRIAGVVITHGHEDHIGALPYFLRRFDVPVWAPPYALGLIRDRIADHEVLAHAHLEHTTPRVPFRVGPFEVEPIRVTHSIADATALAIKTNAGIVIHTGDFKFDETPPDGELFDEARFSELGDQGVALLMSDSTNIDALGTTSSEAEVGAALQDVIERAEGAVVVAMFASNVHRLRMLGDIARRTQRRIVPMGRSVERHAAVARQTGYLAWPSDLAWSASRARELEKRQILAVATGTQGETRGALSRLARGEHPGLAIGPGDTVILSSRAIPGSELEVSAMMTELLHRGVSVVSWSSDRRIHTSGHAHRAEQKRMLELVRPRSFIPLHGTLHHLMRHAELARETGVTDAHVIENGDVIELDSSGLRKVGRVAVGRVHCWDGEALSPNVIRERRAMAAEGLAAIVLDIREGVLLSVTVTTRGILDEATRRRTLADVEREARDAWLATSRSDRESMLEAVRLAARRVFHRACGIKPTTVVSVVERT